MPHCANPCAELNGDVEHECGACSGASFGCRPGASGFPAKAASQPSNAACERGTAELLQRARAYVQLRHGAWFGLNASRVWRDDRFRKPLSELLFAGLALWDATSGECGLATAMIDPMGRVLQSTEAPAPETTFLDAHHPKALSHTYWALREMEHASGAFELLSLIHI